MIIFEIKIGPLPPRINGAWRFPWWGGEWSEEEEEDVRLWREDHKLG